MNIKVLTKILAIALIAAILGSAVVFAPPPADPPSPPPPLLPAPIEVINPPGESLNVSLTDESIDVDIITPELDVFVTNTDTDAIPVTNPSGDPVDVEGTVEIDDADPVDVDVQGTVDVNVEGELSLDPNAEVFAKIKTQVFVVDHLEIYADTTISRHFQVDGYKTLYVWTNGFTIPDLWFTARWNFNAGGETFGAHASPISGSLSSPPTTYEVEAPRIRIDITNADSTAHIVSLVIYAVG